MTKTCCTLQRGETDHQTPSDKVAMKDIPLDGDTVASEQIEIPGGRGFLGTDNPYHDIDEESPLRQNKQKPFLMDAHAVTNSQFSEFVDETGYVTEAEKLGDSFVFAGFLPQDTPFTQALHDVPWWRMVKGASWRVPFGPEVKELPKANHPVVHASWHDAMAYANWSGGRLPLEAEWEHAARGGLGDVMFPWGNDAPNDQDYFPCNIWQGRFPTQNTAKDGYIGTAPVDAYKPNKYGLFNMVGNVWEWTAQDFKVRSMKKSAKATHAGKEGFKIVKGGSFLCHISYCYRYRIAARTVNSPDSATSHTGFRLVYDQ